MELLPGSLTPHAHECLVRLGVWIPSFDQARQELAATLKVEVSKTMSRRQTEAAGKAYVEVQRQEVERIEQEIPLSPAKPTKLQVSTDGAMVPLVGGEWKEVKTVIIGEIQAMKPGQTAVKTENISYFSRQMEAQQFNRLALAEMHRRGAENAQQIAVPVDGAEWIQGFIDFHCPEAVRILDFAHAAERISDIAHAIFEPPDPHRQSWLEQQLHQLKHRGPTQVLAELHRLQTQYPDVELLSDNLAYLQKRKDQMQYPTFQAQGLPIGSGAVESAHKVVVQPRLKGAGMHWAPDNVNPMVALRTLVCNDRWDEQWPLIALQLRQQATQRQLALKQKRRALKAAPTPSSVPLPLPNPHPTAPLNADLLTASPPSSPPAPYRPAANHPWRRSPIGKARFQSHTNFSKN